MLSGGLLAVVAGVPVSLGGVPAWHYGRVLVVALLSSLVCLLSWRLFTFQLFIFLFCGGAPSLLEDSCLHLALRCCSHLVTVVLPCLGIVLSHTSLDLGLVEPHHRLALTSYCSFS